MGGLDVWIEVRYVTLVTIVTIAWVGGDRDNIVILISEHRALEIGVEVIYVTPGA